MIKSINISCLVFMSGVSACFATTTGTVEFISKQAPSELLIFDLKTTEPFPISAIEDILSDTSETDEATTLTSSTVISDDLTSSTEATSDALSMQAEDNESSGIEKVRFLPPLPPGQSKPKANQPKGAIVDGKVKINYATEKELETVLEIDSTRAHAIVIYRQIIGGIRDSDDLKMVFGIDESMSEQLQSKIIFDP